MENGAHAATGAVTGAAVAYPATSGLPPVLAAAGIALAVPLGAGAALLPDLDHDDSTITRSGGPITRGVAEVLQALSRGAYRATRASHDPASSTGEHRGLIHTPVFAVLLGALLAAGTYVTPWVGLAVTYLLTSAAIRALRWHLPTVLLGKYRLASPAAPPVLALAATAGLHQLGTIAAAGSWIGAVVALGMIVHSLGDGATNAGIPFAWPLKRRCDRCRRQHQDCPGARWDRQNVLPAPMRWSVGTRIGRVVETGIEVLCLSTTAVLAVLAISDMALADLPHLLA